VRTAEVRPGRLINQYLGASLVRTAIRATQSCFSKMARPVLRRIRVTSKEEPKARFLAYLDDLNREPLIHTWTYKIDMVA
jgi:hypothetical protein